MLDELDAKGLIAWSAIGNPRKIVCADEMPFKKLQDMWEFKEPPRPCYPTEKNIEMLRTIVATSSIEDSIVLDCFSGSGTTLIAADQLDRSWIGIDSSEVALKTALGKLKGRIEPAQASLFAPASPPGHTPQLRRVSKRREVSSIVGITPAEASDILRLYRRQPAPIRTDREFVIRQTSMVRGGAGVILSAANPSPQPAAPVFSAPPASHAIWLP